MSKRPRDDLRRRPVGNDRDVEITEIEEDDDEYEDDPLVLKGSRPTGPPKKLSEGTEEEWGIEDDGDWGAKSQTARRETRQTARETQEQRIRRVMERSNQEVVLGLFLHLALLGFYVYVFVYDGTNLKRTGGKGFVGLNKFGGRWKYLTYIDLWVQFGYFFLMFLHDIMPDSYAKKLLSKFCDFTFTSLVFPLAIFVAVAFWGLYAIDRELIYPAWLDEYIPQVLNHFWHTTIVFGVILELLFIFHRYPTTWNALATIFTFCTTYIVWIVIILTVADFWVYSFLKYLPPPVISVFFAVCFFVIVGLYYLGKMLGQWRWRERHLLIEELRL